MPLLRSLEQSTNFKTKIHSATTLLKFKNPKNFETENLYYQAWLTLVNALEQHNKAVYSASDMKKYASTLDNLIFELWQHIAVNLYAEDTLYE